uniref:Uncharacterized protein n=1 Tax=Saimiri boliviensis boliviensis TaxID=39432 RepID=A0A2K6TFG0_SAIBB
MAHLIAEIVSVEHVVPGSAATTLRGDLLEELILRPHQDQLNKKFWGWCSKMLMNQMPIKG